MGACEFIIPYNIISEGRDFYEKELKILKSINATKQNKKLKSIKLFLKAHFNYDIINNNNNFKSTGFNNSINSLNQSIQENSFNSESKKITIKDLCPEEKGKIGELLKKLAKEKEEKELLLKTADEDKKNYENKIDLILKEK